MWRLTFPVLGAILFGAHLYFWGNYLLLPIPLILLILLFIPFRPVCWLWEICLICFGVEWLISAYQLYLRRIAAGMPFVDSGCLRNFNNALSACILQPQN